MLTRYTSDVWNFQYYFKMSLFFSVFLPPVPLVPRGINISMSVTQLKIVDAL